MNSDLLTSGRIFDIQRYSIHDGPGIRTIVFFKGCRLRCRWCCNPESQNRESERMAGKEGSTRVGRDVTVEEILPELLSDLPYYRRSGGGVTLSGGEALCQPDFAAALLRVLARDNGVDTAMETTGFAPAEDIERVLPDCRHVLLDIKHMDSDKHRAYTTQPNHLILENAHRIAELQARLGHTLTVRVPVVPGFNDTEAEIRAIAMFARSLPGVEHLHLLPYHRLGEDKYTRLGREYGMAGVLPPSPARMKALLGVAEESGLYCRIGG